LAEARLASGEQNRPNHGSPLRAWPQCMHQKAGLASVSPTAGQGEFVGTVHQVVARGQSLEKDSRPTLASEKVLTERSVVSRGCAA
jgi:hypothetical protein